MGAGHGGKRKGAGRPPGSRSRATASHKLTLSEMAREHTESAILTLVEVMTDKEAPPNARVSAASAILDRGYGKPRQEVDHSNSDGSLAPVAGFDVRVVHAPSSDPDSPAG